MAPHHLPSASEAASREGRGPLLRSVTPADTATLWQALYYAAHVDEQPGMSVESLMRDGDLARYVTDWGRDGDVGVMAEIGQAGIGAAWLRLMRDIDVDLPWYAGPETPELAIGLEPAYRGCGVGTQLLERLLKVADEDFPSIVLTVREGNPARRLYERLGFVPGEKIENRVGTTSVICIRQATRPSRK